QPSFLLDQLTFLIVAIVFAYPFADGLYSVPSLLFLFILTYFLHVGFNILANKIGLKKVPW
ncbi:MAG: CDP-archaeol synthase, partial [Candidatus Anstonellales archaeon]